MDPICINNVITIEQYSPGNYHTADVLQTDFKEPNPYMSLEKHLLEFTD